MFTTHDAHDMPDTRNSTRSVATSASVDGPTPTAAATSRVPPSVVDAEPSEGSTIRVPWIMFIPHANLNSPTLSGVNSKVAVPNAGNVLEALKSANTTREVQSPDSWRSNRNRSGTPSVTRITSGE